MIDFLISLIPDAVVGKHASSGFDILVGDDALCLNKQCFANISVRSKGILMCDTCINIILLHSFCTSKNS